MQINTLDQLKTFLAKEIVPKLKPKTIVLLSGDLGAGKTQTVKFLVELLGGDHATSPTFSVINEYTTKHGDIYHIDLYRIKSEEDLESTGFWDLFQKDSIIMIEWPDKIQGLSFPTDWKPILIHIHRKGEERIFSMQL